MMQLHQVVELNTLLFSRPLCVRRGIYGKIPLLWGKLASRCYYDMNARAASWWDCIAPESMRSSQTRKVDLWVQIMSNSCWKPANSYATCIKYRNSLKITIKNITNGYQSIYKRNSFLGVNMTKCDHVTGYARNSSLALLIRHHEKSYPKVTNLSKIRNI